MKQHNSRKKIAILPIMLAVLTITLAMAFPAQAQKVDKDFEATNDKNIESGYASILIGLLRGQYVKVSVVNQDNKAIPVKFVLVDKDGKVLILCDDIVQSGKASSETFQHPGGGPHRIEFYAQIRTANDRDLKFLIPSVQIIDTETDRTEHIIGGDDFFAFRPIFNPPFIEMPEIQ